jgi:hypothetical protein
MRGGYPLNLLRDCPRDRPRFQNENVDRWGGFFGGYPLDFLERRLRDHVAYAHETHRRFHE